MDIKELLLTGLIILIAPFVTPKKAVMIPVFMALIFTCMNFPFNLPFNFQFDLRQIPFILGALYGGYTTAIVLILSIFAIHFLHQPEQFLNPFALLLICIFVPFFANRIQQLSLTLRIAITSGIGLISGIVTFLTAVPIIDLSYYYGFVLQYLLTVGIGLGASIYFHELLTPKEILSGRDLSNASH